jgi:hypothetical protein
MITSFKSIKATGRIQWSFAGKQIWYEVAEIPAEDLEIVTRDAREIHGIEDFTPTHFACKWFEGHNVCEATNPIFVLDIKKTVTRFCDGDRLRSKFTRYEA